MSDPLPGVFVTGTDTGVGKTVVSCALVRGLRARGIRAGAMKPVETGVAEGGPADALALRAAAGNADPLEDVCPQTFALAAAPIAAARAEGRSVDLAAIEAAHARLRRRHAWLAVEGAGGLLVPLAEGVTMADLAARLSLPVLVVARAALGTLNHTRLTLEAVRARDLTLAGVVVCHAGGTPTPADLANLEELRRDPTVPQLGEVPHLAPGQRPAADLLDLDALLGSSNP